MSLITLLQGGVVLFSGVIEKAEKALQRSSPGEARKPAEKFVDETLVDPENTHILCVLSGSVFPLQRLSAATAYRTLEK